MLRKLSLFILIICSFTFASIIEMNGSKTEFTLNQIDPSILNFSLKTGDIITKQETNGSEEFTRLSLPDFHISRDAGEPELPEIHRLIEIPQNANPRIEVINSNYIDYTLEELGINNRIFPAQPSLSKSQNPGDIPFEIRNDLYLQNTYLQKELVSVNIEGQLRAIKIANLNIRPVYYNPTEGKLRIYTDLEVNIHMDGANFSKTNEIKESYYSPYFESIYNQISNYSPTVRSDDMINDPVTYIIITNSIFLNTLGDFIDWKTQKGFNVIVGSTAEIGSSTTAIKSFIEDLYNNPPNGMTAPSFVLFVGDIAQIPSYSGTTGSHPTDLYYVDMSGDMIPDIYHGRFSAQNLSQLQSQINKTLEYEKYEMPDPSYLSEVLMVSGVDGSFAATHGNGQINYGNDYYFNNDHGIYSHTYLYPASDAAGAAADIIQDYNEGVGFANYTAHCSPSGWADPSFTVSDVPGLYNDHQYNLMIGNCCNSAQFDVESFGEAVLRSENNGAVGYIGGTNSTYWDEDYWWGVGAGNVSANPTYEGTGIGIYDGIFHENGEDEGQWFVVNDAINMAGNLAVVEAGSSLDDYYWEIYHNMGDPSLITYMGIPSENNLTHTEFLPLGSSSISISGAPYTYVGITHNGNLLGSGQLDSFGNIDLSLSGATVPGIAQIVGTCQNHQPYFGEVLIASPDGPYVLVNNTYVTSGYNNMIEYGESVELTLTLENVGNDPANSVSVEVSTNDIYTNITNGTSSSVYISANGTAEVTGITFDVSDNVPNDHNIELNCIISSGNETWESTLNLTAYAPVLNVTSVVGDLDPGASTNLIINIINNGGTQIIYPVVSVESDSYTTINNYEFSNAYSLEIDMEETLSLNVTVNPSTPIGHLADFTITIMGNLGEGPASITTFSIPVGQVTANFEAGLGSLEWDLSCSGLGCSSWGVDDINSNSGSSSAKSGAIGNNQSSDISVTLDVTADGEIDFYYRVSAEYSTSGSYFYDGLEFYIDNNLMGQYQSSSSGGSPWTNVSYPVSAGEHTFRWSYVKDGGGGSTDCDNTDCEDAAWIDDIIFPPAYMESNVVVGDLNGDSTLNVLDVVLLINMILGTEPASDLADLNGDGVLNILDVVQEINLILGTRANNASHLQLFDTGSSLNMVTDGYVGAIKIVLEHDELFSFDLTDNALVAKSNNNTTTTTIIIVVPESNELFSYNGNFEIVEVEAANSMDYISVELPYQTSLDAAYPNPFNPVTTISYTLSSSGDMDMSIYNITGQLVDQLVTGYQDMGNYNIVWNAHSQPSGMYILRLTTNNTVYNQKLMLIK